MEVTTTFGFSNGILAEEMEAARIRDYPRHSLAHFPLAASDYLSEEAKEGKYAFVEKRKPDFGKFPRFR